MTDTSTSAPSLSQLAAAAPAERDRYADLLRLFSITMVALGHWVVALLTAHGAGSVSTSMPLMLSTWIWQVMALFFFVGGFAHARALRHEPPTGEFVRARLARLLPPATAMLAIWTVLATAIELIAKAGADPRGAAAGELNTGMHKITVPLWFLGVYLMIVLAAPAMMRLHRRYGLGPVLGVLAVAAAVTDLISIGAGLAPVGYANLLFVWLAVHQLGFGYADGTLTGGGRRLAAVMAIGGLAGTIALVFGPTRYPVLMVGLPGNEAANSSPPTCALLTQSVFLIGLALLLRPAGSAWVRWPKVWLAVAAGNSMIMTIFCWHLSACYLVQGALLATGTRLPAADTGWWLLVLPAWLVACTLVCAGLVVVFRRFERLRPPAPVGPVAAVTGLLAAAVGLFAVSETGLNAATTAAYPSPAALLSVALVGLAALGLVKRTQEVL
jgi:peptidoglycan/LPS O-acetylase OafA/YrhL